MKEGIVLAWNGARKKSLRLSLRLRLFALLALFAAAIILALAAALSASGVFSMGMNESRVLLQNELDHIAGNAKNDCELLTVEGITLSGRLAEKATAALKAEGISASELKSHPELLEDVLRECLDTALAALERNAASGVFVILDATINSDTSSRAGLFLRNMEPNALNRSTLSVYYLRGPIVLARQRNINVLPQWLMEFPVSEGDFFHKAMAGADGSLPLARTYYWNPAETLAGDYDDALLLCVPLVASDGAVLGICGFEINELLFKMRNLPDTSVFGRASAVFAPVMEDGALDASKAMFSGTYALNMEGSLSVAGHRQGLSFFAANGTRYIGLSAAVRLYGRNTVHGGEYAMAVIVPEGDLTAYAAGKSRSITLLLAALLLCAVGTAILLSRRYLAPVLRGLEQIKRREEGFTPVNVPEIDDLLKYLAALDEERKSRAAEIQSLAAELSETKRRTQGQTTAGSADAAPNLSDYGQFLENLKTLTATERAVFDLYMGERTAREIADELFITDNTVKFHNKNIYRKLGVSSLKVLRVYMKMMKEAQHCG
jgi:DNA-binding CsgD family transcriptional regulator